MAEIATFTCSNRQCLLTVRVARDFPVWDKARTAVVRHRSETYCTACKKVVEYADAACIVCQSEVVVENLGRACPRCAVGTFAMPHLSVI